MSRILKLFRRFQARRRDVVEAKSFLEMSFHKFLRFDSSPIGLIIPETFDFIKCTKKEKSLSSPYYFIIQHIFYFSTLRTHSRLHLSLFPHKI